MSVAVPALRSTRPDRRAPMLQKARNLRDAIARARAAGNEPLRKIWEEDYAKHCAAYAIEESEL